MNEKWKQHQLQPVSALSLSAFNRTHTHARPHPHANTPTHAKMEKERERESDAPGKLISTLLYLLAICTLAESLRKSPSFDELISITILRCHFAEPWSARPNSDAICAPDGARVCVCVSMVTRNLLSETDRLRLPRRQYEPIAYTHTLASGRTQSCVDGGICGEWRERKKNGPKPSEKNEYYAGKKRVSDTSDKKTNHQKRDSDELDPPPIFPQKKRPKLTTCSLCVCVPEGDNLRAQTQTALTLCARPFIKSNGKNEKFGENSSAEFWLRDALARPSRLV